MVIGVAVVVGFIVVFMAMYTAVLERTREIGILKAVGGSSALILNILFRETLLLALLGLGRRHRPDLREPMADGSMSFGRVWCRRRSMAGGRLRPASPLAAPFWGRSFRAIKAVKQDVTEALSYE